MTTQHENPSLKGYPPKFYPNVIGIERTHEQVGDCVIAIKALYALRILYPKAKIIVFTSLKGGGQLYSYLEYVDSIIDVPNPADKQECVVNLAKALQENPVDVLLLLHRTSWKLKVAKNSPAKLVITELHLHNLFSKKFKSPRMMISYFVHGTEKVLRLVRKINPSYYDANIANIDFSKAKMIIPNTAKEKIQQFLTSKNSNTFRATIGVNIFGSSAPFNFSPQDWENLVKNLAQQFPHLLFVMLTYEGNPYTFKSFIEPNIVVFQNDSNLINLVALTACLDLLLSLNTGNIHIADHLQIPTLVINKTKERYNCIGGSYGGEFDAVYLPKNWKANYAHYYNAYAQKVIARLEKF